jgi:hypothetical protein
MDDVSNQFRFQQIPNPWVGWTVPFQHMIDSFKFSPRIFSVSGSGDCKYCLAKRSLASNVAHLVQGALTLH